MRVKHYVILFLLLAVACGEERPAHRATGTQPGSQNSVSSHPDVDWPMFMHDISYLGISSDKTLRPPLDLVWKFKTGGPVNSSPVVSNGTVYAGSDDHRLYALQARKWGVKWDFEAGDRIIYAPTVYQGTVYFSARDSKVYAIDAATGTKRWDFQADGWINAPIVAFRQKIYFGCYDSKIYVLDAATGKRESQKLSSVEIGGFRYICSEGEFYPLDAPYRASKWRQELPLSESWPATANGVVYIGARDSRLRAFDQFTREEIWQFKTDGWVDSSAAIANGMLYIGSRDGYIYAFGNAAEGSDDAAFPGVGAYRNTSVQGEAPADPDSSSYSAIREGVITHDRVQVYDRLASDSPYSTTREAQVMALLNEGMPLPMTGRKQGNWYEVMLPDQRIGWISTSDFIPTRWVEDLQANDPLVKDVRVLILPNKAEEPSWSSDGSIIAFFDDISMQSLYWRAKSFWLASSDGSDPAWVTDGSFLNPRVSWSGNGRWVALENLAHPEREVWIVRSNGIGLKKVADGEAPAFSPRSGRLAFIRRNKDATNIWVRELTGGTEARIAEIPIQGEGSHAAYSYIADLIPPAWSPGGTRLAVGLDGYHYPDRYSRVAVISTSGGVIREMAVRAERVKDIAWSPDGSHLAYITQGHSTRGDTGRLDKKVHLTKLNGRDREEAFENCEGIAWSPDGRYLAFIEENDCMGMRRKVWLLDVNIHQRIQLLASRENIRRVFWFTDGRIGLLAASPPSESAPRTRGWIISISLPG